VLALNDGRRPCAVAESDLQLPEPDAHGCCSGLGIGERRQPRHRRRGDIYIVEDFGGGEGDDLWFAKDLNNDGDLTDPGEGLGRWASNGTVGSEFTGLYFDPFDKRRAWVNIQHPTARTIARSKSGFRNSSGRMHLGGDSSRRPGPQPG
jgi:hypothetical protein